MILTLLGKPDKRLMKKFISQPLSEKENSCWFFADYCASDIPVNSQFDVLLAGRNKLLVPGKLTIRLLTILDQFGNQPENIPNGFQSICKLQFSPEPPKDIKNLPTLNDWKYNPSAISIKDYQDVKTL